MPFLSIDIKLMKNQTFFLPPPTPPHPICLLEPYSARIGYMIKRVGILYHPMTKAARPWAKDLERFLGSQGVTAWSSSAWEMEKARNQVDNTDLLLTVGGDGTILRAVQVVVPHPIPIVGLNLGWLGFMTELSTEEVMEKVPARLAGEGWIDERAMLEAELLPGDAERGERKVFYALNDVVMARGAVVRIVWIDARINDEPLTSYRADGVIVATATGSTGYSLATGGPILYPQAKELVLVPILPHLSPAYAMVLPATSVVKLHLSTIHQATLSIDGHMNLPLSSGDSITVKLSPNTTRFLRIHPKTYFYSSLERRLKGR